jgi:hypothetical protein
VSALDAATPPTEAEVRAELDRRLERHLDGRTIASVERRPSEYQTSFALDELAVTLEDGSRLELVLKRLGREALSPEAELAKPSFLGRPLREIEVYESLLGNSGEWAPICYGSVVEPALDRYWLFLERLPGVELWQVGDLETWCEVARWLARMHRAAGKAASTRTPRSLLRHDIEHYQRFAARALEFGPISARVAAVLRAYDPAAERLAALPVGVAHGELYASNVLIERHAGAIRVAAVDWEMAALGPPLIDLAALTSGGWAPPERRAMVLAYREACERGPEGLDDEADLLEAVALCRLQCAVQWLGWSKGWTPPAHQAHDWSVEAERAIEELGL